jgi:hypothetical protein
MYTGARPQVDRHTKDECDGIVGGHAGGKGKLPQKLCQQRQLGVHHKDQPQPLGHTARQQKRNEEEHYRSQ